jgi:hypothetical protein
LLNPLTAVPALKPLSKLSIKLSSKPKEIIDLGVISLGSYRLSPPLPSEPPSAPLPSGSLEPLPSSSPSSPSPVVRHMTPA